MTWIILAMFVTVLLAAGVVVYVAFPHRGEDVPHSPWLGTALRRLVDALATLGNDRYRGGS